MTRFRNGERRVTTRSMTTVLLLLSFRCNCGSPVVVSATGGSKEQYHRHRRVRASTESPQLSTNNMDAFWKHSHETLGIETYSIALQEDLPYYDYTKAMNERIDVFCEDCHDDDDDDWDDSQSDRFQSVLDLDTVPLRGLVATAPIAANDLILRIPHNQLWTISTVIDQDEELSLYLGATQRTKYGWTSPLEEIPLLAIAILCYSQRRRAETTSSSSSSSIHEPYLDVCLLYTSPSPRD